MAIPALLLLAVLMAAPARAADWVVYEGARAALAPAPAPAAAEPGAAPGTEPAASAPVLAGAGKSIVFVTGDEEYRSEEGMPMLARILAERHGFRCTVLFAVDPDTGEIKPDHQTRIPGLELLAGADLMVLFTRFRELPDAEMKHIVDYVLAGKPIVALRTSTHAFHYTRSKDSPYAHWSWDSEKWSGGFGKQVLGETWVSHHGDHKHESCRGVLDGLHCGHPVLRGVVDVWGPTDVYGIRDLPADAKVLLHGLSLSGMESSSPPNWKKPLMPIAWTREIPRAGGAAQRVFCTTMGASVDLTSDGLRRLLINACYWAIGLEAAIPAAADVAYVAPYAPTFFGFGAARAGVKPADLEVKD